MTENKIAPTQDLEELYRLYKHERDDRIMLREESGQLSPELRLKVHLSKTHGTDSSGSIYICLTFPQNILFVELKKCAIFMRLRSKLSFSEFYDKGAWKFLILLLILQNHTLAFNFECHSINLWYCEIFNFKAFLLSYENGFITINLSIVMPFYYRIPFIVGSVHLQ